MLSSVEFENRFVEQLPCDECRENRPRQVEGACYSRVEPRPVGKPSLIAWSSDVAGLLGLLGSGGELNGGDAAQFERVFSGSELLAGMQPYAMCYGGHQFGQWAGQLGDGRAISLGEISVAGDAWTLQLKGAGPTPYSRTADGLAVLRSSVREFLCSEAMHFLGVPTTRALSLILTGESVVRDMFYDGNPRPEPGAVVCRVARSFIRFGSFEIFAARQDKANLERLADFTIRELFPDIERDYTGAERYLAWYQEVLDRTVKLMVDWQRFGFVHGVMNTDNMSVLGETIDYGPYGWLEPYDLAWTPNTTDAQGRRYCYGNQPGIALWNLARFGTAIMPLVEDTEALQTVLDGYQAKYEQQWLQAMAHKLGLQPAETDQDQPLIEALFELMQKREIDMTLLFRALGTVQTSQSYASADELPPLLLEAFYSESVSEAVAATGLLDWIAQYQKSLLRCDQDEAKRRAQMDADNPLYVLRNYLAQQAIELAEQGDYSMIRELLQVLQDPFTEQPGKQHLAQKRPEWARDKPGSSMLSCSS